MGSFLGGVRATNLLIVRQSEESIVGVNSIRNWVMRQVWREVGGVGVDGGTAGFFDMHAPELYGLTLSELRNMLTSAKFERSGLFGTDDSSSESVTHSRLSTMSLTFDVPSPPPQGKGSKARSAWRLLQQQPSTSRPTGTVSFDVTRLLGQRIFASCPSIGVICSAGFGDEGYPVFVNENGSAAIIEFIGSDVLSASNGRPAYVLRGDPRWESFEKDTLEQLLVTGMKLGDVVVQKRMEVQHKTLWIIDSVSGFNVVLREKSDERRRLRVRPEAIHLALQDESTQVERDLKRSRPSKE
eukprot:TRINITY_DN74705_c0_g1_i1.p1 TRINITY_DN74705_c0_g1~~TRINITY_DN74705_c0_g1_i1.p1  ORF type:complete len:298 (-),score=18.87 TRINITY_DN74705_c0_g1_i1:241-1134(-)